MRKQMPKTATNDEGAAQGALENEEIPLSLEEYCTRLSAVDRRVELISAFHAEEALAGRVVDVESAYALRFDAFINRPA